MKLSDLDSSTRKVVYLATLTAKARNPDLRAGLLPKLREAVAEFEKAHDAEMFQNLARMIWPKPVKPKMEYCDMCDGTGLMEGWNRRDGHPCPKCKGAAVLPADQP